FRNPCGESVGAAQMSAKKAGDKLPFFIHHDNTGVSTLVSDQRRYCPHNYTCSHNKDQTFVSTPKVAHRPVAVFDNVNFRIEVLQPCRQFQTVVGYIECSLISCIHA